MCQMGKERIMAKFVKISQRFINIESIMTFEIEYHYARRYLEIRTSVKEDTYSIELEDECDVTSMMDEFSSFIKNEEPIFDLNKFWEEK